MSAKLKAYVSSNIRGGFLTCLDTVDYVLAAKKLPLSCCRELMAAIKAGQIVGFSRIGDVARI